MLIQSVVIERSQNQTWLAAVLLGELVAGDGFYAPRDGAAVVVRCVSGTFYGRSAVTREDQVEVVEEAMAKGEAPHLTERTSYVYRRTGEPCRVCGTPVSMRDLAGRTGLRRTVPTG